MDGSFVQQLELSPDVYVITPGTAAGQLHARQPRLSPLPESIHGERLIHRRENLSRRDRLRV